MWVETPNPDTVLRSAIGRESLLPRQSIVSSPYDASAEYGFLDSFGASFLHENTVASALHAFSANDTATEEDYRTGRYDNFNPYAWLKQTQTPEVLKQLAPAIDAGEFEASVSPRVAKAVLDDLLYEAELQKKMDGSYLGSLAGGLVTGFLDPTTYIPFVGVQPLASAVSARSACSPSTPRSPRGPPSWPSRPRSGHAPSRSR
jgi:hypothetical protein